MIGRSLNACVMRQSSAGPVRMSLRSRKDAGTHELWHDRRRKVSSHSDTDIAKRLGGVPLFKGVGDGALGQVARLAQTKHAAAGESFFNEGDEADSFYVLLGGRVKLTQLTAEGHQVTLRFAGPGEAFGGVGAFGDPTYPVSAEAVEPSDAALWSSPTMRRILEQQPAVALNAVHMLAERLYDLQQRYRQLMTERVERRVARALLRLVNEAGRKIDGGIEITFPVSRQDVAEMTGTTLFTVSRLLSAWEQQGIVHSGRQHIVLAKPHALVAIAEDLPPR
jgi:CRP-like cAMP-binding protein